MSGNEDFEAQLKQEEFARQHENEKRALTYTDKDGTVFEWDSQKKAYFPKIDEDFIANYQMNYGLSDEQKAENAKTEGKNQQQATSSTASSVPENSEYTWEDYCRYYQYYYGTLPPEADQYYGKYDLSEYYAPQTEDSTQQVDENSQKDSDQEKNEQKKGKDSDKTGEKRKRPEGWFEVDNEKNTNVYVSGLPSNTTEESFVEMMSKCGMIMYDPFTKKPKIKVYREENGEVKGDARCCYIKNESVLLALQIIDGSNIDGHTIHVERAQFQLKGKYDPSKKKKMSNKMKKKLKQQQQKLFDWRPDKPTGARLKHERIVIISNAFDSKSFEKNPDLINKVRDDVKAECGNYGEVRKVTVYDHHVEGVVSVIFKEPEMADSCVQSIHKRIFLGRVITAEIWDGKTKYEVTETDEDREARLKKWQQFLNESESNKTTATTHKPEDATTTKPDEATTTKPQNVTTTKPEDVTKTKTETTDNDKMDTNDKDDMNNSVSQNEDVTSGT